MQPKQLAFLFAAVFSLAVTANGQTQKSLVIGVDGMGYGVHGFDVAETPWMDDLIAGVQLTRI